MMQLWHDLKNRLHPRSDLPIQCDNKPKWLPQIQHTLNRHAHHHPTRQHILHMLRVHQQQPQLAQWPFGLTVGLCIFLGIPAPLSRPSAHVPAVFNEAPLTPHYVAQLEMLQGLGTTDVLTSRVNAYESH